MLRPPTPSAGSAGGTRAVARAPPASAHPHYCQCCCIGLPHLSRLVCPSSLTPAPLPDLLAVPLQPRASSTHLGPTQPGGGAVPAAGPAAAAQQGAAAVPSGLLTSARSPALRVPSAHGPVTPPAPPRPPPHAPPKMDKPPRSADEMAPGWCPPSHPRPAPRRMPTRRHAPCWHCRRRRACSCVCCRHQSCRPSSGATGWQPVPPLAMLSRTTRQAACCPGRGPMPACHAAKCCTGRLRHACCPRLRMFTLKPDFWVCGLQAAANTLSRCAGALLCRRVALPTCHALLMRARPNWRAAPLMGAPAPAAAPLSATLRCRHLRHHMHLPPASTLRPACRPVQPRSHPWWCARGACCKKSRRVPPSPLTCAVPCQPGGERQCYRALALWLDTCSAPRAQWWRPAPCRL